MGFFNSWSDLVSAATPWSQAEAESVSGGSSTEKTPAMKDDGGEGEVKDPSGATPEKRAAQDAKDDASKESTEPVVEEKEEEEEEEEEDEEEMVDPKDKFEDECKESAACAPSKHHYDECIERVTGGKEQHPGEDCVEEFFHLAHCVTACAAPKLWNTLK
ncbi:ubiquinol-cytochrome c reductase complex subunit [Sclerotinia borealis F-4128]|uniref:Cytochrome b-c1 complex subunit 6, mitochondrial n=1 Tax=Sclerotinia borealis (strain F-4128) TaxID=1432307 RepID=W9CTD1_SCLBF|nr:ubiquinol-cytochrome c reductase complex subunit [Sclerotinia borealis F-4128]